MAAMARRLRRFSVAWRFALVCLLVIGVLPTAFVDPASAAPAAKTKRKVVIFAEGVCSQIDGETKIELYNSNPVKLYSSHISYNDDFLFLENSTKPSNFKALRTTLVNRYGFNGDDFLEYSYQGGHFQSDGTWQPAPYDENDPARMSFSIDSWGAAPKLVTLMEQYASRHSEIEPEFVLIGHSMGGVVAFEALNYMVSKGKDISAIASVITVDSPLVGINRSWRSKIVAPNCTIGEFGDLLGRDDYGQAVKQLEAIHDDERGTRAKLEEVVDTASGVVHTVGNKYDCLWEPDYCLWNVLVPDGDIKTQWLKGAHTEEDKFNLPCELFLALKACFSETHSSALRSSKELNRIANHIGAQYDASSSNNSTNVDVALIIDSSGSMSSNDPLDKRKDAARTYVNASQPGDFVGVVDFDGSTRLASPLTRLPANRDALLSAIGTIDSDGSTNIGAGVQAGCDALINSTSSNAKKAAIFLTDGDGSYNDQANCFASRGWPIYAFGLGSARDTLLQGIADATGGEYKRLPTSDLVCEFQRVRAKIAGVTPSGCTANNLSPLQLLRLDFTVPTAQQSATFSSSWLGGLSIQGGSAPAVSALADTDVVMSLISPSGRRIERTTTAPDVTHDQGSTFEVYTIANPESGVWQIELFGANVPSSGTEVVFAGTTIPAAGVLLFLSASDGGSVGASPAGPSYPAGTTVQVTATPAPGHILATWVVDGVARGWANPLDLTMDTDHSVIAVFAPRTAFSDVPSGSAAHEAITQLTARGLIRGYTDQGCTPRGLSTPCFGPADDIQRSQLAAIIVRAFRWQNDPGMVTPFSDITQLDPELQAALGILAQKGVAKGYGDGTFGPFALLNRAQAVSFVTRSMVEAGYWQQQTVPANLYGGILNGTGHEGDVATFIHYAGPVLGTTSTQQAWPAWTEEAEREWFARLFWQALDSHFGVDRVP